MCDRCGARPPTKKQPVCSACTGAKRARGASGASGDSGGFDNAANATAAKVLLDPDLMHLVAFYLAGHRDALFAACGVCRTWLPVFRQALDAFDGLFTALIAGSIPVGPAAGLLRDLNTLSVRGTHVPDAFLEAVAGGCPGLLRLDIRGTGLKNWTPLVDMRNLAGLAVCCRPFQDATTRGTTLYVIKSLRSLEALLVSADCCGGDPVMLLAVDIAHAAEQLAAPGRLTVATRGRPVCKDHGCRVPLTVADILRLCLDPSGGRVAVLGLHDPSD